MLLRRRFQIIETPEPITTPSSKFGGQPVWLHAPHWPLDPATDQPMRFLAQLALDPAVFPDGEGIMAYLFFGAGEPLYNEAFAVVLQTKDEVCLNTHEDLTFVAATQGPSLYEVQVVERTRQYVPKEYQLVEEAVMEEPALPLAERYKEGHDLDYDAGYQFSQPELAGNKIGGQAIYVEGLSTPPAYFTDEAWELLLQLAPIQGFWNKLQPNFYPFHLELGEFGLLHVFMTKDRKRAEACVQMP